MKLLIATRSRNDALYAKASAFWPAHIPRHRVHCPDPEGEHNALVDARWNKSLYEKIIHYSILKQNIQP